MSQLFEQETADTLAGLGQNYHSLQAALETLSTEQLQFYLHEVEWVLSQLEEIPVSSKDSPQPGLFQQVTTIEAQVLVIQDILVLERTRRGLAHLQAVISNLVPHVRETIAMAEREGESPP